ncbi:4-hydroxyphenylacetate 3-hydroxylase family protein [Limnochorda pilosa]|uniref:Pyoverdin chromophore biosynthetic protein pvcC n=1 Tax=Limnochorda pilosa TaxID=1555112 RepID=A0A0K2SLW9_LIMPI|nr:4-hydroxyphenylacetate 3-hydroxylase N-terminal domain-containing protein [Limnochorda pilosa]BAS28007.1 Pyoverdin chromophore biosynthetic protein pvcC [Limnochorda pilosa]
MSEETVAVRALDGEEYLESLRDGRQVYFGGERVKDVANHPAFRNAARSIARLYDALHDPEMEEVLMKVDRWGIATHRFFAPAYSAQDLLEAKEAIAAWQRLSYGWMGRTPDYKASFMATLAADPEYYAPFGENARRWYREYASRVLFLNHVIVDPPVDRNRPHHEVRDVYVHVVKETGGGIYVTGAKQVATQSALTHASFVAANSGTAARFEEGKDEDFALVFLARMETPGQILFCRPSFELKAESPFDQPLSSRFDENDAVLVFDNAFIPWEDVLAYRDVQRAKQFYAASGFFNRFNFQATIRMAIKLDFMCGLLLKGLESNGTDGFRGVQVAAGELITLRNLFWALASAMALDPEPSLGGSVVPKLEYAAAARVYTNFSWDRVRQIFESLLGGSPIVTVSSYRDLMNPDLRPIIDRYLRGTGIPAEERIKLFKLVWDAVYSEFAGRHGLYELNYAGNNEQKYLDAFHWAHERGLADGFKALVDQCMSEYDLDGWKVPHWTWNRLGQ